MIFERFSDSCGYEFLFVPFCLIRFIVFNRCIERPKQNSSDLNLPFNIELHLFDHCEVRYILLLIVSYPILPFRPICTTDHAFLRCFHTIHDKTITRMSLSTSYWIPSFKSKFFRKISFVPIWIRVSIHPLLLSLDCED